MDSGCYLRNCTQLTSQTPKVKNQCNVPVTVHEDIDGCESWLPVDDVFASMLTYLAGLTELPGIHEGMKK